MALSEFEIKKITTTLDQFIERRRPPVHIRDEVDLSYRLDGQSVVIYEIRAQWHEPDKKIEIPVAKATYVKSRKVWKILWQMSDLKWHYYEPQPEVKQIEDFVEIVDKDQYSCFWG